MEYYKTISPSGETKVDHTFCAYVLGLLFAQRAPVSFLIGGSRFLFKQFSNQSGQAIFLLLLKSCLNFNFTANSNLELQEISHSRVLIRFLYLLQFPVPELPRKQVFVQGLAVKTYLASAVSEKC